VTDVKMDIDKMMKNKAKAVTGLTGGIEGLFKKNKVTYVKGFGSLASPNSVSVALNAGGQQTIEAKNIIIAVGSEVTPLPTVPVDNAGESQSPTLVSHSYPISRAKDRRLHWCT
jgi:dihydrolipoamide dehydrogenase